MRITIQIVIEAEPDKPAIIQEVAQLEREQLQPETLGLQLVEAKTVLLGIQQTLVEYQARAYLAQEARCSLCDQPRRHKGKHTLVLRTLFGTIHLASPRLFHCSCQSQPTQSFSPLAALLPERSTPELVYVETKFAARLSKTGGGCCRLNTLDPALLASLCPDVAENGFSTERKTGLKDQRRRNRHVPQRSRMAASPSF